MTLRSFLTIATINYHQGSSKWFLAEPQSYFYATRLQFASDYSRLDFMQIPPLAGLSAIFVAGAILKVIIALKALVRKSLISYGNESNRVVSKMLKASELFCQVSKEFPIILCIFSGIRWNSKLHHHLKILIWGTKELATSVNSFIYWWNLTISFH